MLLIVWAAAPCLRIPCSTCTEQLNSWKGPNQFLLQFFWSVVVQRPSFHCLLSWATWMTRDPSQFIIMRSTSTSSTNWSHCLSCRRSNMCILPLWKHAKTPREESRVQMQLAHPLETVPLSEDLKYISRDILQSCQLVKNMTSQRWPAHPTSSEEPENILGLLSSVGWSCYN